MSDFNKIEKDNINVLSPFKLLVLQNFPFIEADFDAITNYQLMCKMTEYMNNINTNVNTLNENENRVYNAFNELVDYINNYFDNLDVQEEISTKLDEMVEDGTFDTIIDRYTIGKNTFRTKLYFEKLGRFNFTDYINNGYIGMQGGEKIDDYFVFALIKDNDSGDARIFKVNLNTGSIVGYNDVSGLYHANGCCKKENSLFFTQTFDNNSTPLYGIAEVNISTLEVITIHNINFGNAESFQINAIGYNGQTNKFILIGQKKIAITNENFEIENIINLQYDDTKFKFVQGGGFYNGFVCIVTTNENSILCFNLDGTLHHVIEIGWKQASNQMGELEDVTILSTGDIYINSNLKHSNRNNLFLIQFFKSSIYGGGLSNFYSNNTVTDNAVTRSFIVDKTTYNNLNDYNKFSCNGTAEKPFESIAEAISYMDTNNTYIINIADTNDYPENLTILNKNLIIKGNNSRIGTLKIVSSKVGISNINIERAEYRTPIFGSHEDYITPLYISTNSDVSFEGNFSYNLENCSTNMVYPCIIEGSTVYDNSNDSTTDYKKFIEYNGNFMPLITHSIISTRYTNAIRNNKICFTDYLPSNTLVTGVQTIDLNTIPQYVSGSIGLIISITTALGNSHEIRLSSLHANENVVIEDVMGGTTARQGFRVNFRPSQKQIVITPYSYDHNNNVWTADNTIGYRIIYTFYI